MIDLAVISLHTSPLAQPGTGDGGGMNVYVRHLVSALAHRGLNCVTYTRADRPGLPAEVEIEPNHRLVHIAAGDPALPKEQLGAIVDEFTDGVLDHIAASGGVKAVHGNYWLSGMSAHRIKHELDIPLLMTFHTLARVKGHGGDPEPPVRERAEVELLRCCDAVLVSCDAERDDLVQHYGVPDGRIVMVSPGVELALFGPGDRRGARRAIGTPADERLLLFVGRLQPLKSPDLAIEALAALGRRDTRLLVTGGSSGVGGADYRRELSALVDRLGVTDRVEFLPPQPHHLLATYYRAADAVVVPSRSESFGLVALEAAACGTPVVASAVGGLLSLVDHGETGLLVPEREAERFAVAIDVLLSEPSLADSMGARAAARASAYTWRSAASQLAGALDEAAAARDLVACS